ncbi:hypothetical protein CJ030_MR5G023532 [Morella rubra]|uniref:Uncharacterized protein n=1 Tax=Morella rubra TaxID=262757 RepID=A0A6A1VLA2_9ROSI|nr:hypothetical protein CJ030_MR5G023532 [Morella rubra]
MWFLFMCDGKEKELRRQQASGSCPFCGGKVRALDVDRQWNCCFLPICVKIKRVFLHFVFQALGIDLLVQEYENVPGFGCLIVMTKASLSKFEDRFKDGFHLLSFHRVRRGVGTELGGWMGAGRQLCEEEDSLVLNKIAGHLHGSWVGYFRIRVKWVKSF